MLDAVAENEGLSASDKIRQLIRREFINAFGEALKPKPPKRR